MAIIGPWQRLNERETARVDAEEILGIFTALLGLAMVVRPRKFTHLWINHGFSRPPFFTRFRLFWGISHAAFFAVGLGIIYASLAEIAN